MCHTGIWCLTITVANPATLPRQPLPSVAFGRWKSIFPIQNTGKSQMPCWNRSKIITPLSDCHTPTVCWPTVCTTATVAISPNVLFGETIFIWKHSCVKKIRIGKCIGNHIISTRNTKRYARIPRRLSVETVSPLNSYSIDSCVHSLWNGWFILHFQCYPYWRKTMAQFHKNETYYKWESRRLRKKS